MKYLDEFRNGKLVQTQLAALRRTITAPGR
jgi:hypothetical protein